MEKTRIILENVGKKFKRDLKTNTLEKFLSLVKREKKDYFYALKNISFEAKEKEIIGILGKNSSGKSTLLRIIAGIYKPTEGSIKTNGKIIYLSNLGFGLKPKLTMKENVYLIGSIMGLNKKEIREKFNEIIEFSGLKDYVNTKVYQFSTGMIARLNFSTMIFCFKHQNPDILLLDEIFSAGGDLEFNKKAIEKMEELIKSGATVILVSHDLSILEKYCNRTILLDNGRIIKQGKPKEIISFYLKNG